MTPCRPAHHIAGLPRGIRRHDSSKSLACHRGKSIGSFAVLDLMRLPLGILTGMGFIGAGAMIKRGWLVHGVTTAATLWFVTVIGLCFGGGQISLGIAALAPAVVVVSALRWLDRRIKQDHQATPSLTTGRNEPTNQEIYSAVRKAGYKIKASSVSYSNQFLQRDIEFTAQWRASQQVDELPRCIQDLMKDSRAWAARWKPLPQ